MSLMEFFLSVLASIIGGIVLWKFSSKTVRKYKQQQFFTKKSKQLIVDKSTTQEKLDKHIDQEQKFSNKSSQEYRDI